MQLIDFIIEAKLAGYAAGGEAGEAGIGAAKGHLHGFNPFGGSERVFDATGGLVWMMNYYGEILPAAADPKRTYAFLRQAMARITPDFPFRGPAQFQKGALRYRNHQHGDLGRFHGVEQIFEDEREVYRLHYHGGRMTPPA